MLASHIAFRNGTFNLVSKEFSSGTDCFSYDMEGFTWESSKVIEVMKYLRGVIPNEEDLNMLLVSLGRAFVGKVNDYAILLIGSGSNGKTALLSFIDATFDKYSKWEEDDFFAKLENGDDVRTADDSIIHSRVLVTQNYSLDLNLDKDFCKATFTHGHPIRIKRLFKGVVEFVPKFQVIIESNRDLNELPEDLVGNVRKIFLTQKFVAAEPCGENQHLRIKFDLLEEKFYELRAGFAWILMRKYIESEE